MKKVLILSLVVLTTLMLTGCGKKANEENKENNEQKEEAKVVCDGCIFSIYNESKKIGKDGDKLLDDNRTDYKQMTDGRGVQIGSFLGHILDPNGVILNGYACQVINDKLLCLGQIKGEKTYASNKELLKEFYTEEECSGDTTYTICVHVEENNNYSTLINVNGLVQVKSNGKSCGLYPGGRMSC